MLVLFLCVPAAAESSRDTAYIPDIETFLQFILIDGQTGRPKALTDRKDVQNGSVLFARDGRQIYYRSNEANGRDFHVYRMALAGRARGVVDTLIFPGEGHGASKRPNVLLEYRTQVDFFSRHLTKWRAGSGSRGENRLTPAFHTLSRLYGIRFAILCLCRNIKGIIELRILSPGR